MKNVDRKRDPLPGGSLWKLVRGTAGKSGQGLFNELTRSLGQAFDMQMVAVSEVIDGARARTIALWTGEDWSEPAEFLLADTPCGRVAHLRKACCFPRGVREEFPHDTRLADWKAQSFLGTPLLDTTGRVIGLLCLFGSSPIPDDDSSVPFLETFASRAAAELARIQAERESEKQRAFLRQVLDINPSLIFAKDREGRFTLINQAVADAYGTTVEDLTGKTDADFNPNEDEVASFRRMDLEVMDKRRERFIPEEPLTQASGEVRWVQTIKRPIIGPSGRADQILGVATDITELKRTREKLLQQQQEDKKKIQAELDKVKYELIRHTRLATIGQVAASIAHELRNPLGSISNAVYFLRRRNPDLDPKWVEYFDVISQEVRQSERIIADLLEMSRPKEPHKEVVVLAATVEKSFEQVRRDKPIALQVSTEPDPFEVWADSGQLRQVFDNLLTNAVQALNGGGSISVTGRREPGWDVLTLEDDGPGVPPGVGGDIFEPLFTRKAKGTGLGLAICRQILERHGGSIRLLAAERGAAFEIRLPQPADRP